MTSYTARIVLEGWGDQTLELDQYERDQILVQIGSAMARKRAEDERREQEKAKTRTRGHSAFTATADEAFNFSAWAGAFAGYADVNDAFRRFTRTATPPPPRREQQRPSAPHPRTVTDALAVLEEYTSWTGQPLIPPAIELRTLIRRAKRKSHPDTGGTAADFQRVTAAEDVLRRAGRI